VKGRWSMTKGILEFITKRRSVRAFTGEPIDRAQLELALQAAMAAPSARNSQPWEFLVITERDRVQAICAAHPYAKFGEKAGAVVLPIGVKEGYGWFDQDMGAATENFLLAIANLGLGATWCGMPDALQPILREQITLPEDKYMYALIPVGVPAEDKPARTQYESSRVHWETY